MVRESTLLGQTSCVKNTMKGYSDLSWAMRLKRRYHLSSWYTVLPRVCVRALP